MAAAMGSSIKWTSRAPAWEALSRTARCSTSVTPEGTEMMMRGLARPLRWCTFLMKWRSIRSVTSKSAITPSRMGRMATMLPGVRPSMALASDPTLSTWLVPFCTETMEGSRRTMPSPRT